MSRVRFAVADFKRGTSGLGAEAVIGSIDTNTLPAPTLYVAKDSSVVTEFTPQTLGRFELTELLGEGGMGAVYRARDPSSNEWVAIKTLSNKALERGGLLSFKREYQTLASLQHPNIIKAYDYGLVDGKPYYTMECLEGVDLNNLQSMSLSAICSSLRDVASALAYLHARRLIHRDVTMRNIRIGEDGRATLFDFGILATVGATCDLAGTPPFVPPEALQRLPLDHRVDLYALGALAYRYLAGHHAYPARSFRELPALWELGPKPLSELRPDVPPVLNQLIIGLLAPKRLARPSNASEVIDSLSAIGDLPPLAESEVSRAYLASAALVGRQNEMQEFEKLLVSATSGTGSSVVLRATSGIGKSRLLAEAGLVAQLSGFTSLHVDCGQAQGSYGVTRSLMQAVLRVMPTLAAEAAKPDLAVLARITPELAGDAAEIEVDWNFASTLSDRVAIQEAITRWFRRIFEKQRLFITIDDFHRADDASAAVLASIALMAKEHSILLILGIRLGEESQVSSSLNSIETHSTKMVLHGLNEKGVSELLQATFGAQIVTAELAQWMHRVCDGNPMRIGELSHQLVKQKILGFQHGEWSLLRDLELTEVPASLSEALDSRIAQLDDKVLRFGQILAVLGGDWSLQELVTLSKNDADSTFIAVDALIAQEVVIQSSASDNPAGNLHEQSEELSFSLSNSGPRFQLRHDGLREALLRSISKEQLVRLNRRAAQFLEQQPGQEAERIAWHLLRGEDKKRAADMLEEVGMQLFHIYSLRDALAPMKAALSVFETHNVAPSRCMKLRRRLVLAGMFSDRATAKLYLDSSLELAWRYSGMHVGHVVGNLFGRTLGFLSGLAWANVVRLFRRKHKRGPKPITAFTDLITYFTSKFVHDFHTFETTKLDSNLKRMKVLGVFEGRIPMGMYRFNLGVASTNYGQMDSMIKHGEYSYRTLVEDKKTPMADSDRQIAMALSKNLICFSLMLKCDPKLEEAKRAVNQFGLPHFDVIVQNELATVRRAQGYEKRCLQMLSDIHEKSIQLGSTWAMDTTVQWQSSLSYALTGDLMGLRRSIKEMTKLSEEGIHCVQHLALAKAEYRLLQRDLKRARKALTKAKQQMISLLEQPALAMEAELLLAEGKLAQACAIASQGMAASLDADTGLPIYQSRYVSVIAWSMAPDDGLAMLRESLQALDVHKNPAASGRLCECAALICWQSKKQEELDGFIADIEHLYTPTENPVLLRRLEELRTLRRTGHSSRGSDNTDEVATHRHFVRCSTLVLGDSSIDDDSDSSSKESTSTTAEL